MTTIGETADAIGDLFRTLLGGLLIGAIGYGGGWLYSNFAPNLQLQQKDHQLQQTQVALTTANHQIEQQQAWIGQLDRQLRASKEQVERLDLSLRLMKVTERVAEIRVLRQSGEPTGNGMVTEFQFQELDKHGQPVDAGRTFQIVGDLVYVDYWVVKFEDELIEQADSEHPTSICLFHRIFGEFQQPYEGFTLDQIGQRPSVYGRNQMVTDFEQRIWSDFWNISNNRELASQMGIRAAHGEAVAARLRPGRTYRVTLRASGGLSIRPVAHANVNAVTKSVD
ncbi:MAG: hypothetical protein AAF497_13300 [Planctomycetota bacterium]